VNDALTDILTLPLQIKPVFTLVVGEQEISLKNNPTEAERAFNKSVTPQIPEPNILSELKKQYNNEIDAVTDLIRKIERANLPLHVTTETTNWICLPPDTDMLIKEAALSEVQIHPDFDLITLSHNAICTAIKASHSLSSSDFNVWDSYLSNYYQEVLGRERVLVTPHIFPNENNAVIWERQLWQTMHTPPRLLHPRLVQVMEDNTRFVLFSRSLLSELITYDPSLGFVLALPHQTVRIQLSDTARHQRGTASFEELLSAAYAFVSVGTDIRRGGERNRINYKEVGQFLDELTKSNLNLLRDLAENRYERGVLREVLQDIEEDTSLRQDFLDVFELIIQDWLQVAQRQITLEHSKSRRPIKRLENFYVAGPPLTPKSGKLFVGRQQVFRNIEEAWRNPLQKQAVVLHGQRRLGKTSILYHLSERLGQSFIPVLLDLQGMAVEIKSEETLWSAIAQRLRRSFKDDPAISKNLHGLEVKSAAAMSLFLDRLEDSLGDDRWVILSFDEFEKLEEKIKDGTIPNNFLDYLRSLIQHRQQILVLLAGHHTLKERMGKYWGPLMGVARSEHLTFLSESESRQLITDPWDGFQLRYKPEAVDRLVTASGGQPMLLQLACSGVIKLINRRLSVEPEISPTASLKDILDVLHEIAADSDKSSFYFDAVWDWLTDDERNLSIKLARLADETKGSQGWVEKSRFSDNEQHITERLVTRDIIEKEDEKYRFRVELLRWWISNHEW
jgi:AAA+ ATPase superfamily predicted ATPase